MLRLASDSVWVEPLLKKWFIMLPQIFFTLLMMNQSPEGEEWADHCYLESLRGSEMDRSRSRSRRSRSRAPERIVSCRLVSCLLLRLVSPGCSSKDRRRKERSRMMSSWSPWSVFGRQGEQGTIKYQSLHWFNQLFKTRLRSIKWLSPSFFSSHLTSPWQ